MEQVHRVGGSSEDPAGSAPGAEAGLIQRARRGDPAAWEALVRAHQEPVFRFAYLILGDPDDAEDAAQEVFVRAYQALERFDLARPLRPWLLSITANLARNRRRSLGRYLAALQRLGRGEPVKTAALEEKSDQRWQARALWQAVQRLSLPEQQVIYLRYFLEMDTHDVSVALNVPAGTVKSRLHRALNRLKAVIEREAPELVPLAFPAGVEPEAGGDR